MFNKMMNILDVLKEVENFIYTKPYDDLTDYLKGIRDMINLITDEEEAKEVLETIKNEFDKV